MNAPGDSPYEPGQQPGGGYGPYGQPGQHGQPYQQSPGGGAKNGGNGGGTGNGSEAAGIASALLDVNFTRFISPKIIKPLYILWLAAIAVFTLSGIVQAVPMMLVSPLGGLFSLLSSLVGGVLAVLLARVLMEVVILVLRINDDVAALRGRR